MGEIPAFGRKCCYGYIVLCVFIVQYLMGYMFYYIDQLVTPSFPIGLVKTESDFIVRSVETGLGRWTLVVAVISVDTYPFFGFLRPDLSP